MTGRVDVLRRHGFHHVRVKRLVQETEDTRSFVLDVPEDLRDTFRYQPGQFCTFRVHIGDVEHTRCYSMSSAPETDDDLTVTVKRVPGGVISNWFNDHVSEGDVLEVTRPSGTFCVRPDERPIVSFCGGSGITPVMSIAKSALGRHPRPVRLLYANRDPNSVIFAGPLEALRATVSGPVLGAPPPRPGARLPRRGGHPGLRRRLPRCRFLHLRARALHGTGRAIPPRARVSNRRPSPSSGSRLPNRPPPPPPAGFQEAVDTPRPSP